MHLAANHASTLTVIRSHQLFSNSPCLGQTLLTLTSTWATPTCPTRTTYSIARTHHHHLSSHSRWPLLHPWSSQEQPHRRHCPRSINTGTHNCNMQSRCIITNPQDWAGPNPQGDSKAKQDHLTAVTVTATVRLARVVLPLSCPP
jgi:hypothetical protein